VLALFAADRAADAETLSLLDDRAIVVASKMDLQALGSEPAALGVSTKTGDGVANLLDILTRKAADLVAGRGFPPPTRARHREALSECVASLDAAAVAPLPELAAEELRRAADWLGRLTGRIDIEEMLDAVFRDFCIGK
jgi:tRNA modification GTPase